MDNEEKAEEFVNTKPLYVPTLKVSLNDHTWIQRGNVLFAQDDDSLTAALPQGVSLVGEKGDYKLVKRF